MRNNKVFKIAIRLFAVIMLMVLLYFFLQKFNAKTEVNNKGTINTKEVDKDTEKTSVKSPETVTDKAAETEASTDSKATTDTKEQASDKDIKAISEELGITVFTKAASFGSSAEMLIDKSKFSKSYKYYQIFLGDKPISKIESITKTETTIFPAQEVGSEVKLILLNENKTVQKRIDIKLEKKN